MIKVCTLASGYDSQCLALNRLKKEYPFFDYELKYWSEIDKYAIKAHNALFPQYSERNLGDLTTIDWSKTDDFDLLFYSTPCFAAGTLINTNEGFKPIEDIKVGDFVLTHKNRYKRVLDVGKKPANDIVKLRSMMFDEIYCTPNHPFYTCEKYYYGHNRSRKFGDPNWKEAGKLTKNDFLCYPINNKSELPLWGGVTLNRGTHCDKVNKLNEFLGDVSFWYLMGRYVGDGWQRYDKKHKCIIIAFSERNKDTLISAVNKLGFNYNISKERTCDKMTIYSKEICEFVNRYGRYAHGKKIDFETLNLPVELLKYFLSGYIHADGCITRGEYSITTTSRELAFGVIQAVAKCYNRPARIYKTKREETHIIENRTVKQKDTYIVKWHNYDRKQDKAFCENGFIWFPIRNIDKIDGERFVYNMEVEEDNSYTANGAAVHNCQSISHAGLEEGFKEGSGTKSAIIWSVLNCLKEKRPQVAILENVSAMVNQNFIDDFNDWQRAVARLGYTNFIKVLNAKNYGVPQSRERVFMVSILNCEKTYYFPLKKPCPKLVDLLEHDVADKYYISEKLFKSFIEGSIKAKEAGNGFCFDFVDPNGAAKTITTQQGRKVDNYLHVLGWSRDCKGEIINWHEVLDANTLTANKRTNTQNYILELLNGDSQGNSRAITTHYRDFGANCFKKGGSGNGFVRSAVAESENQIVHRVRRFTEKECFRLMGVKDCDIEKIQNAGISGTQQYKLAGNSIVVDVLFWILYKLYINTEPEKGRQTELF